MADTLAQAELVISSDLTLIECDRVLIRAVVLDELHEYILDKSGGAPDDVSAGAG